MEKRSKKQWFEFFIYPPDFFESIGIALTLFGNLLIFNTSRVTKSDVGRSGRVYSLIFSLSYLIASFILIILGFGIYGTILGGLNLISLVTIYVLDKSKKELSPKNRN